MDMPSGRDINSSTSGASGPASRKRFTIRPINEVFTCLDRKAVPQLQSLLQRLCMCTATKVFQGQLRDRQQLALHLQRTIVANCQVLGLQMF